MVTPEDHGNSQPYNLRRYETALEQARIIVPKKLLSGIDGFGYRIQEDTCRARVFRHLLIGVLDDPKGLAEHSKKDGRFTFVVPPLYLRMAGLLAETSGAVTILREEDRRCIHVWNPERLYEFYAARQEAYEEAPLGDTQGFLERLLRDESL